MKTVWSTKLAGFDIKLRRRQGKGRSFEVIYGQQVKSGLTYAEAATELGRNIMHALTCEGLLDGEDSA